MKKKIIAGMMSVLLATGMTMPVGAANPGQQSGSTQLNTSVESSFILTIPATTNIVFNETKTQMPGSLKVSGNVDTNDWVLVVATTNPLEKITGESIDYSLTDGTNVFTDARWNETELRAGLTSAEGQKEIPLFVEITEEEWKQAKAGNYTGTVTFVAGLNMRIL